MKVGSFKKQARLGGPFGTVVSGTTNTATAKGQEPEVLRAGGAGQAAVRGLSLP